VQFDGPSKHPAQSDQECVAVGGGDVGAVGGVVGGGAVVGGVVGVGAAVVGGDAVVGGGDVVGVVGVGVDVVGLGFDAVVASALAFASVACAEAE
jgi:hypothetical protein